MDRNLARVSKLDVLAWFLKKSYYPEGFLCVHYIWTERGNVNVKSYWIGSTRRRVRCYGESSSCTMLQRRFNNVNCARALEFLSRIFLKHTIECSNSWREYRSLFFTPSTLSLSLSLSLFLPHSRISSLSTSHFWPLYIPFFHHSFAFPRTRCWIFRRVMFDVRIYNTGIFFYFASHSAKRLHSEYLGTPYLSFYRVTRRGALSTYTHSHKVFYYGSTSWLTKAKR